MKLHHIQIALLFALGIAVPIVLAVTIYSVITGGMK